MEKFQNIEEHVGLIVFTMVVIAVVASAVG